MKLLEKGKLITLSTLLLMLLSSFVNQAFAQSHLSRANCINNESISWSALGQSFTAHVRSQHVNSLGSHKIYSSASHVSAWRHAAIDWGEGNHPTYPGYDILAHTWTVIGRHCAWDSRSGRMGLWISEATGCFGNTEKVY